MKLQFILLLLPFSAFAQEIPKFVTTITVKNVGFSQVKTALLDSGYFLESQLPEDGTLVTKERNMDRHRMFGMNTDGYHIVLMIRIKDSVAVFKAKWRLTDKGMDEWQDLEYWKGKSSVPHALFIRMDQFAAGFKQPREYSK